MDVVYQSSHSGPRTLRTGHGTLPTRGVPLGAGLWVLLATSAGAVVWAASHDDPVARLGLCVDRVTSVIALLVAGIGVVAYRYSERCLAGNASRQEFLGWMAATVGCAVTLAMANSLPLLAGAWIALGACLDRLLRFFRDRPEAVAAAHRTRAIGTLGDLLMCAAFAVAWSAWGATSVTDTAAAASAATEGTALAGFSLLLCTAVIVKSAQVPLHGWLPDTMESPTPVSALMHAGIVNAGGALLIRLAPAIERVPEAWLLLSVFGTASILVAAPATWFSARAKTTLAWSTVSQMGFMLVQCALCAFPAALLHIMGHGLYKAWSFLRAGELPQPTHSTAPSAARAIALLLLGSGLSAISLAVWANAFDLAAGAGPGKLALLAILAIALGQCWVALLGRRRACARATFARVAASAACTALAPAVACALYAAAALWLGPTASAPVRGSGAAAWIAAALPVAAIALLAVIHAGMPALERHRIGARLRIHAMSGFYLGIVANRSIDRIHDIFRTTINGVTRA